MNEKIKGILGNSMYPGRVKDWLESQGATDFGDLDFTDVNGVYFVRPDGQAGCIHKIYSFLFEIVELPRWRAINTGMYYFINSCIEVVSSKDTRNVLDNDRYKSKNYFKTEHEAEEYCYKVRELLQNA